MQLYDGSFPEDVTCCTAQIVKPKTPCNDHLHIDTAIDKAKSAFLVHLQTIYVFIFVAAHAAVLASDQYFQCVP